MTSPFVAAPLSLPPGSPHLVENDGWFPDIDLDLLKTSIRIDPSISIERLRESVVNAIQSVARQLRAWRDGVEASGAANLGDVPAPKIGGESRLLALYRRAIHTETAADLSENLRDIGTTNSGHDRADELADSTDVLRRNARWAVSDFLSRRRMTVEMI